MLPAAQDISVREGRNMRTRPWGHQVTGVDFLQRVLRASGGAAMLQMWMGTGKSWIGVSMACNLPVEDVLIVAPLRVVDRVWPSQFEQHAGRTDLLICALGDEFDSVKKKTEYAQQQHRLARARGHRFICIINYQSLWREPFRSWALSRLWGLVMLDESHRIKAPGGKASMYCNRLRSHAKFRLCLTGTMIPHSPLDTYAQYRFLSPDILGTNFHAFRQRYAVMGGFNQKQVVGFRNLDELEARLRPITFVVGKDALDLPEEISVVYHSYLGEPGAKTYRDLDDEFRAEVVAGTVTVSNAMVKLLRLQQITGGAIKTDDGTEVEIDGSKAELLLDTLDDIDEQEPVVVFCRFHHDLDTVHRVAKACGRPSAELSGRRDELAAWARGEARILAVQITAGGEGVNEMVLARYSIFYSLTYSLGEYDQARNRVHRPGQKRSVMQIHLVAKGTVDERIMRALEKRQEVVQSILNELKEQ